MIWPHSAAEHPLHGGARSRVTIAIQTAYSRIRLGLCALHHNLNCHRLHVDSTGIGERQRMTVPKKKRATALIPWSHNGNLGVLVHADSYKNEWILPGGGLEPAVNGQIETPRVAVVRGLREETGLIAGAVATLFRHDGKYREHHVFHIRASGALQIVDQKEAPAFGLCRPDFVVDTIACSPGYITDGLKLSFSTRAIIGRYFTDYQQLPGAI